jgi:hypothetical protein
MTSPSRLRWRLGATGCTAGHCADDVLVFKRLRYAEGEDTLAAPLFVMNKIGGELLRHALVAKSANLPPKSGDFAAGAAKHRNDIGAGHAWKRMEHRDQHIQLVFFRCQVSLQCGKQLTALRGLSVEHYPMVTIMEAHCHPAKC